VTRFEVAYDPRVEADLARLPKNIGKRVLKAISERLHTEPEKYGRPLSGKFARYRKLRVGDVRVVFELSRGRVIVYAILVTKRLRQ
jgi:mRNA interferase RelE/StbE